MERRRFLKTAGVTAASASMLGAACAPLHAGDQARGNVVVIHVDDLGWRDLGCMGSPVYETPNIDRLAQSGTLFTDAYASAPICSPSRACMLTGSQPSRHGVYTVNKNRGKKEDWKVVPEKNNHYLDKAYPTIGTVLTDAGIANGAIGKWHVGVGSPSNGFSEGKWGGYLGLPINYFAPFELDFYPTICSFMGVEPVDPEKVDGEDLTGLIFHGTALGERNLFWNFPSYADPQAPAKCPRSAMRRGEWKIIHRYEDNGYELYNLKNDIGESNDVATARPDVLNMMRRELEACYERFGAAKSLPANPAYTRAPR